MAAPNAITPLDLGGADQFDFEAGLAPRRSLGCQGVGPCGGRAALELARRAGPGRVTLIGEEWLPPYDRPSLSKAFLESGGDIPPALFGAERFAAAGVELVLGDTVIAIDRHARRLSLSSGRRVAYTKLLIATGARARALVIAGAGLAGVLTLRSHADALRLRSAVPSVRKAAVIGGGFIGLECASSLHALGMSVTVLEAAPRLLARTVPTVIAEIMERRFGECGIEVRTDVRPTAIRGERRAEAVELANGSSVEADLVIAGVGSEPDTGLAQAAGLKIANGIVTDAAGRTSDPAIYAAGDVADRLVPSLGARRRLEAWEPALERGAAVAAAMTGEPPAAERAPWAWSDQLGNNIQVAGYGDLADRELLVGERSADGLTVLQLRGERLVGAATLNRGKDMALCRRALTVGARVRTGDANASVGDLLELDLSR